MKNKRPFTVSLVCWTTIILVLVNFATLVINLNQAYMHNQVDVGNIKFTIPLLVLYLSYIIPLLASFFMLAAKNWARVIYIGWSILIIIYTLTDNEFSVLILVVSLKYMVLSGLLINKKANVYFSNRQNGFTYV